MSQRLFLTMLVGSSYGEKFVSTLCFDIKHFFKVQNKL